MQAADDILKDFTSRIRGAVEESGKRGLPQVEIKDEFRRFRNQVDFVAHPEGIGLITLYENTRQYQHLRDFYRLLCTNCNEPGPDPDNPWDCWHKTPLELQEEILLERDEDGVLHCPQCNATPDELQLPTYNVLIGIAGMRSGKTMLSAAILLCELHDDLMMENPQKEWGIAPGQEVYYTCCTTKAEQAKDTIFAAVDGLHENSPWFQKYTRTLLRRAQEQGIPADTVYVHKLEEIRYLHKQLFIDNTGANSAGIAGKTRKLVVMDEIARFIETDSRMGVDLVYDTLKASLLTLAAHGSKMVCISSPIYKTDKIMRLCHPELELDPRERDGNTLYFHHATWDFNPKYPFDHPFIQQRFAEDAVAARRDYGADPPGAKDPWIEDEWRIDECVDPEAPLLAILETYNSSLVVKGKRTDMVSKQVVQMDITTTPNVAIACDPGHLSDSFGLILGYVKPIRTVRGVENHMFVGLSEAWEPTRKPRREVDFASVLNVIKAFGNHWLIDKIVYDQWNSVLMIQDLMATGMDAERIKLTEDDWRVLKALIYNKQVHLLGDVGGKGANRLRWELKNLQLLPNGKVDHSPNTSSDLAVCLCRLAKVLVGEEAGDNRIREERSKGWGVTKSFARP